MASERYEANPKKTTKKKRRKAIKLNKLQLSRKPSAKLQDDLLLIQELVSSCLNSLFI